MIFVPPLPQEGSNAAVLRQVAPAGETVVMVEDLLVRPGSVASWGAFLASEDRIVAHDGTVTALVPPKRTTLLLPNGPPDPAKGSGQREAFLALVASLDRGQIAALTSRTGLSLGTLRDDEQRNLFQRIVAPGGVPKIQTPETGLHPVKGTATYSFTPPDTSQDWRTARLRMGEGTHVGIQGESTVLFPTSLREAEDDPRQAFGVEISKEVPNSARPGALPRRAGWMEKSIDLNGLASVGDLIARVKADTGIEIYADGRLAKRKLAISGVSAPAGDLLLAVAHGIRGTYRSVGPVLLLTDDEIGLGSRASAWGRFFVVAQVGLDRMRDTYAPEAFRRLSEVPLPAIDELALTPGQRSKLDDYDRRSGVGYGTFSLSELTPAQRDAARALLADPPRDRSARLNVGSATVQVDREVVVSYAGFEAPVGIPALLNLAPPDEPANAPGRISPPPSAGTTLALPLLLANLPDALEAASRAHVAEVWLVAPPDAVGTRRLTEALSQAKANGLKVRVALKAFALVAGADADRDIEGRSADVRPPSPSALTALAARLSDVPAVVLFDSAPYGYGEIDRSGNPTTPLGYGVAARLAFLRKEGYDPIDLVAGGLPLHSRDAFYSTAFSYDVATPAEVEKALEASRQQANLSALEAFRASYRGSLLTETREPSRGLDAIFDGSPTDAESSRRGPNAGAAWFRVPVPALATPEEAASLAAGSRKPVCFDLSAWKVGVPSFIRGLFGAEKVP